MDDIIVKTITRLIVPFIQVYGIFVILHGHISPGGGFSGGAVLGSSMILFTLSFGLPMASRKIPHKVTSILETSGILWYIIIGLAGIYLGGKFLVNKEAGFFMGQAGELISAGIIPLLTLGIGIKVASTMITLFHTIIEED
ncbi:MnhB domain-containing protein [Alkaliphilus serpentinus]|uniref:Sodium:proton antiporter n=1 Tax=Alkaliphilus serpentinus TaxID=1482731 RepID=A0A833HRQ4_9FIRM|nr:MnhB domain-containing protein [Alkaliphilus serpentinus]KAB3533567.1 sodium:proton antiporter [Alkaliphilus serpentinus]